MNTHHNDRRHGASPGEKLSEKQAQLHYNLGRALAKKGDLDGAIASLQRALEISPDWSLAVQGLRDLQGQRQKILEKATLQKATEHYHAGKDLLEKSDYVGAIACFRRAIEVHPGGVDVHLALANSLVQVEEPVEAMAVYQRVLELKADLWEVHHKLGNLYRDLGRKEEAIAAYERSIELRSDFAWNYDQLADVLVELEEWQRAIVCYEKLVELQPDFAWGYYKLGDVCAKLERWDGAVQAYRLAAKLDGGLPEIYEKLGDGLCHVSPQNVEEICRVYQQAIEKNPDNLRLYYQVLEVNPQQIDLTIKLADILQKQGKLEQAVSFYKRALEFSPNDSASICLDVKNKLASIYERLGYDQPSNNTGLQITKLRQIGQKNQLGIVLFTPYYQGKNPERQQEFIYCLQKNIECGEIAKIVLLIDDGHQPELDDPRIEVINTSSRPTYAQWVELTQKYFSDHISILANTDVYLDESIVKLREIFVANPNAFVAISRYEKMGEEQVLHKDPHWSQDVWAIRGDYHFTDSFKKALDIPLGFPRCDGKIAYLFSIHGARVYNPCNFIKIVHVHETEFRSYDQFSDTKIMGSTVWVYPNEKIDQPSELKINVWTLNPDDIKTIEVNDSLIRWREEEKDQDSVPMKATREPELIEKSQAKIRQFHNKHLGERCVIIGNGPSLNEMDLSFLKDEICFGTNKIFLGFERWDFSPTYYVAVNPYVIEQSVDQIRKIPCPKFIGNRGVSLFDSSDDLIFIKTFPYKGEVFSKHADVGLNEGSTVTYVAMQLAYYMGFSEVILIGVDHHFVTQGTPHETVVSEGNDPNHFAPNYFGKGAKWQLPDLENSEKSYQVAKQVFEESGRKIFDATVNGHCQVFSKQDYKKIFQGFSQNIDGNSFINLGNVLFNQDKFEEAIYAYEKGIKIYPQQPSHIYQNLGECLARQNQRYPRLLLIDWTKTGSISATGQIKEKLLAQYPVDNWLQLYVHNNKEFKLFSQDKKSLEELTFSDRNSLVRKCKNFNPSVIYYRPVSDNLEFHDLACEIITELKVPLVTHIMDDWMGRLFHQNLELYTKLEKSFHTLLKNSVVRLSICEKMSKDFKDRYDLDFVPIANCIDVNDWLNSENYSKPESKQDEKKTFKVRYVGGLADDMNFHSISDLVEAIKKLADTLPVKLEIYTMKHFREKAIKAFSKFTATTIYEANLSQKDYYQLLKSADALIIAYNFDFNSITYTKYSMANKLPECLASGVPTIVYGPLEVATVEYAAQSNCVQLVTERNQVQLMDAIRQLINNYDFGKELGKRAQQFSFEHHSGSKIRQKFYKILRQASLTHSYLEIKKLPEKLSEEVSNKSTKKSLSSFKTHLNVGIKLEQEGNLTKALEEFLAAAELNTSHPEIYHRIGEVYLRQKKYKEALFSYQKALEISPKHYWSWRGLGDIYLKQGNLPKAIDSYHQCLEIEPNYFYGHQRLGQIYQQNQSFKEAVDCYQKALEIKPNSSEIQQRLKFCLQNGF